MQPSYNCTCPLLRSLRANLPTSPWSFYTWLETPVLRCSRHDVPGLLSSSLLPHCGEKAKKKKSIKGFFWDGGAPPGIRGSQSKVVWPPNCWNLQAFSVQEANGIGNVGLEKMGVFMRPGRIAGGAQEARGRVMCWARARCPAQNEAFSPRETAFPATYGHSSCGSAASRSGYESASKDFIPDDLEVQVPGRAFMVTGGNSGIGKATAFEIAKRGEQPANPCVHWAPRPARGRSMPGRVPCVTGGSGGPQPAQPGALNTDPVLIGAAASALGCAVSFKLEADRASDWRRLFSTQLTHRRAGVLSTSQCFLIKNSEGLRPTLGV